MINQNQITIYETEDWKIKIWVVFKMIKIDL